MLKRALLFLAMCVSVSAQNRIPDFRTGPFHPTAAHLGNPGDLFLDWSTTILYVKTNGIEQPQGWTEVGFGSVALNLATNTWVQLSSLQDSLTVIGTLATNAQTTALTAITNAASGNGNATNAQARADSAYSIATNALSQAQIAQGSVNSLSNSVTTVQTLAALAQSNATNGQALAGAAQATANTALTNAATAQLAALTAQTNSTNGIALANAAQVTANLALSTATNALSIATNAYLNATNGVALANTAQSSANTAYSTATNALASGASAQTTANLAYLNATNAIYLANSANTNATNGIVLANTAQTNATNAIYLANSANTNATNGIALANAAQSTANTALANAATAQSAANANTTKLAGATTTEISYLSGVTSPIQAQLTNKVTGPASATDGAFVLYDGTTGKLVKNSSVTISSLDMITRCKMSTSDQTISASTALVDVTGLGITVEASKNYGFEAHITFTLSGISSGLKFAVNGPSAPANVVYSVAVMSSGGSVIASVVGTLDVPLASALALAGTHMCVIRGTIENGVNVGTVIPRVAQNVALGTLTVKRGSYFRVWQIP